MKYVTLKDVCTINMGQSPDSDSYNDNGEGVPFFQGNADFGERYPVTRKWCSAPTKMAAPEDILISVRAPIGAMNYAKEECCIGRGLAALTPDKTKVSPKFIFWLLKGKNAELNSKGTGSTFKAIGRKVLEETKVPDISLEKQLEHSETLEKIYAVIQHRKSELQMLDDLIKARFVEMFNLSDCIYKSLGECTDFVDYRGHTPELSDEGIIRMVNAKSVGKGFFKYVDEFVTEETYDAWMHRGFGYPGDILFVTEGHTFGNTCLIPEDMTKFALGQRVITIKGKEEIKNAFLCSYMQTDMFWKDINVYRTGGTAQGIRSKDLVKVMVPIPPIEQQIEFVRFVHKVDKSEFIKENIDEIIFMFALFKCGKSDKGRN